MARLAKILAVLILVGSVAACATTSGGYFMPTASTDAADLSSPAASAIASDMVDKLAGHVGPDAGTIVIKADDTPFATALAQSLQRKGYAVATGETVLAGNAIPLAYTVGRLDGMVMIRLSTSNLELTRSYAASAAGAAPASPLSIMQHAPEKGEGA